ncbi:MAG: 50S ribosomal protein L24 [Bacteroidetes bacterium]|nr:50S ribosomal protein L24 [Bacteroidota bacterium]
MSKRNIQMQKRFSPKLHLKKGDKVVVIAGANKGATGEILEMIPEKNRAVVDNVNIVKKHTKPMGENPGGINEVPAPIHLSNLMLIDPKSGEPTRVGRKEVDGKLVRYSKKSGEIIK